MSLPLVVHNSAVLIADWEFIRCSISRSLALPFTCFGLNASVCFQLCCVQVITGAYHKVRAAPAKGLTGLAVPEGEGGRKQKIVFSGLNIRFASGGASVCVCVCGHHARSRSVCVG